MKTHGRRSALLAWGVSLLVHGLFLGALLWWLEAKLIPAEPAAQLVPMQLSMLAAPVAPAVLEQPAEPVVEPPPEPVAEPESPPPLAEPAPLPELQPKPTPPKPKVSPPKPKPEQSQARPTPVRPPVPVEPGVVAAAPAPSKSVNGPVAQVLAPVVPAPTPAPASTGVNADAEAAYKARVRQAVAEHKHYPNLARRMHEEGRVVVAFSVDAQGQLTSLHVKQSSGSERLDEAALQAVRDAAPFPPFPEGSQRQRWDFSLPLSFALDS